MRKFFLVLALALGFAVPSFAQVQLHTVTVTDPYNVVIQTPTALSLYTRQQGYSIPVPANATSVFFYIKNNLGGVGTDTLTVTGMCSVNGQDFQGFLANNEPLQIAYNSRVATQTTVSGGNTVIRFNGGGVNADAVFSAAVSGCQNIQLNFSSPTGTTTDTIAMGAAFSFGGLNGFNAGGPPLVNLCANNGGLNTSCSPLSSGSNGGLLSNVINGLTSTPGNNLTMTDWSNSAGSTVLAPPVVISGQQAATTSAPFVAGNINAFVDGVGATTQQIVGAQTSQNVRVLSVTFSNLSATATTVRLSQGIGVNCATGLNSLTGLINLPANTTNNTVVINYGGAGLVGQTGSALCVTSSAAGSVSVTVTYDQW